MQINGKHYRSIWQDKEQDCVCIFDQTLLPHALKTLHLNSLEDVCCAIVTMQVRGAPLIGACAAYGLYFALRKNPSPEHEQCAAAQLAATRPTAINLLWAIERVRKAIVNVPLTIKAEAARQEAERICEEDVHTCSAIGDFGLTLIEALAARKPNHVINILTHCNAGWLATVDWGTALAPIYKAHLAGISVHVWVDETRPRLQGALTAWELQQAGVPHTFICDNAGGHLMQRGLVDMCIVGSDRTTMQGDVCNKIGTYLKALAAHDNSVPFYVALPSSTIDWHVRDGVKEIPIEERDGTELTYIQGVDSQGNTVRVKITATDSRVGNYAFDVTPAHLVTALITEHGIFQASSTGLEQIKKRAAKC
jgi:methylthioribose-1-phosphate isomerase